MTAGNALTPQPESTPQPEPRHRMVINSDAPVRSVSFFDEEERGLWFPVPKSLIRSGLWRTLSKPARALLLVMCVDIDPLNPRTPHTLCTASEDELCALACIGRSTLFDALRDLKSLQIIRQSRPGVWEVFPDRTFARGQRSSPGTRTNSPETRTGEPPSSPGTRTNSPETRTPLLRREREQSGSDSTAEAAAAALLRSQGFGEEDIADLTPLVSLAKLRGYIGNADQLDREGKLRNRRGYLRDAIRKGYSLFAKVELRLVKERRPELTERLSRIVRDRLDLTRDDHRAIVRVFPNPDKTLDRGGITAAELDTHPDQEAFDLIKARTVARARSHA